MTPQFRAKVQAYGPKFRDDLGLETFHVAGMFGNFGVETDQFRTLQERGYNGRKDAQGRLLGGYGWPQWTGYGKMGRRGPYLDWCKSEGLDPASDEANYAYVCGELKTTEKAALAALKRTTTVEAATETFMLKYERPGTPNLSARISLAREALTILEPDEDAAPGKPMLAPYEIKAVQRRLIDLGYSMVGKPDGVLGARSTAGLSAFQHSAGLPVTGELDDATRAALAADSPPRLEVGDERANATAADLAPHSPIVRDTNKVIVGGSVGVAALPAVTGGLDFFGKYSDTIKSIRETLEALPAFAWGVGGALVLAGVVYYAWRIREKRVAMHRVGETA